MEPGDVFRRVPIVPHREVGVRGGGGVGADEEGVEGAVAVGVLDAPEEVRAAVLGEEAAAAVRDGDGVEDRGVGGGAGDGDDGGGPGAGEGVGVLGRGGLGRHGGAGRVGGGRAVVEAVREERGAVAVQPDDVVGAEDGCVERGVGRVARGGPGGGRPGAGEGVVVLGGGGLRGRGGVGGIGGSVLVEDGRGGEEGGAGVGVVAPLDRVGGALEAGGDGDVRGGHREGGDVVRERDGVGGVAGEDVAEGRGAAVGERDGGVGGVEGRVGDDDGLGAGGGDVGVEVERVEAAGAGEVAAGAGADAEGGAVHDAVAVVVGEEPGGARVRVVVAGDGAGRGGLAARDADVEGEAVRDGGAVVADDAAAIGVAGDVGVGDDDVADGAAVRVAEEGEGGVALVEGVAASVDADAAHDVAVAVEVAAEGLAVAADGGEVVLGASFVVPRGRVGIGEVGAEREVGAAGVLFALVDEDGEGVELAGREDEVGGVRGAGAGPGDLRDAGGVCRVDGERDGERVAGEVLDGAGEDVDLERDAGLRLDPALEGEHVGAVAGDVGERAPRGGERRRAGDPDDLVERDGDVDRAADGVRAGRDDDAGAAAAVEGGRGGVAEGHPDEKVLVAPGVVVVAAGVEARRDAGRGGGEDDGAAAAIAALVLVLVELAGGVAELGGGGAAVGEVDVALGVAAVGELEADLVDGVGGILDPAVGVGSGIVGGGGVAGDDLEILVAVVLLLLGEADGGVDLAAHRGEVAAGGARGVDEGGGGDRGGLLRVVVAVVDEDVALERLARALHVAGGRIEGDVDVLGAGHAAGEGAGAGERDEAGDAGVELAVAEDGAALAGAVAGGEGEALLVGDVEAVGASAAGLVPVGLDGGRAGFAHGDVRRGLAGGEDERVALGGVVLPGVGGERDGAVAHGLGGGRIAASRDRERGAGVRDGERRRRRGRGGEEEGREETGRSAHGRQCGCSTIRV